MANGRELTYFLGANTPRGFCSLYDEFVNTEAGDFLWVLKGGPGCGKSGFMRRIGQAAVQSGLDVEYVRCSGDPLSLDGVYIPALHVAYADGTAPHVLEPPFAGAGGAYLDLSRFCDTAALHAKLGDVMACSRAYKAKYAEAYALLALLPAAQALRTEELPTGADRQAAVRRAESLARRVLPVRRGREGKVLRRFLGAFCCEGRVFRADTAEALCGRIYLLDRELGLADDYLRAIAVQAQRRGWDAVCCPDPLEPEKLEAVLLPEAGVGCVAAPPEVRWEKAVTRRVRLDALPERAQLQAVRAGLRESGRRRSRLLAQAAGVLAEAKTLHDALEALYNPHVDFEGVSREADAHIRRLLGN